MNKSSMFGLKVLRQFNNTSKLFNKKVVCLVSSYSTSTNPSKTALYDLHVEHGGKMVDFGGFLLPVQYGKESISTSHIHTRAKCSIFDVSHMLQTEVRGNDRVEFIERITTADVGGLPGNKATLTVFTHPESGGILDDLIVTNTTDGYLYVVSNAGRRDHDQGLMIRTMQQMKAEGKNVEVNFLDFEEQSLVAVQGPQMVEAVQPLCNISLKNLYFMNSCLATIGGVEGCRISRCGYTGEDGVEISIPSKHIRSVVEQLLESKTADVKLAGLGARDSLRLEAGLCLYGSDIDEEVTPVEAALMWLVAKSRRQRADFPGAAVILNRLKEGPKKKRVGLKLEQGPPARHDCGLKSEDGVSVGTVTSGCPSPSLGGAIAMGYVATQYSKSGTHLNVEVRGKLYPVTVTKMPFVQAKYYNGPK